MFLRWKLDGDEEHYAGEIYADMIHDSFINLNGRVASAIHLGYNVDENIYNFGVRLI